METSVNGIDKRFSYLLVVKVLLGSWFVECVVVWLIERQAL